MSDRERGNLISLPSRVANYTFVSVHRVLGLSGAGMERDISIETGQQGIEACLTRDPNEFLIHTDRRLALTELMLSGFRGLSAGAEILEAAAKRAAEYASERRNRNGDVACYVVLRGKGSTTTRSTDICRDLDAAYLAHDVVDSAALTATYRDIVVALLTATALAVEGGSEFVPVAEGVELVLDDGKRLYPFLGIAGSARVRVSRAPSAATADQISTLTQNLAHLPRALSPCRLLVDALKSQEDRLAGFVLSWAAVEMTVNKFSAELDLRQLPSIVPPPFAEPAARLNANVEARDRKVHTFLERLQALLMFLGVDAWESTVASVAEIAAEHRQPLYHRGQFDEPGLPIERTVQIARELLLQVAARFA